MFCILLTISSAFLALTRVHATLDPTEMQQKLAAGAPILGAFNDTAGEMSKWMGSFFDDTPIEMLNILGTHDSCAWNYTGLLPETINTQSLPIFSQLDAGIRFLDIRFGINNGKVMLYNGDALLSDTVQLDDVLWGLYHFLDTHPTETIFASLKVDHGDPNDHILQETLDNHTLPPAITYWTESSIRGTLDVGPFGIDLSSGWKDNNKDFAIKFDGAGNKTAFIEDFDQINGDNQPPATKIPVKFDAVTSHLENANAGANKTLIDRKLFISFASGFGAGAGDTLTPKVLAVGDKKHNVTGINNRMVPWLQQRQGNRFGIVLFDFFDSEPGLVAAAIGLPATTSSTSPSNGTPTQPGGQPTGTKSGSALSLHSLLPFSIYLVASLVSVLMLSCF